MRRGGRLLLALLLCWTVSACGSGNASKGDAGSEDAGPGADAGPAIDADKGADGGRDAGADAAVDGGPEPGFELVLDTLVVRVRRDSTASATVTVEPHGGFDSLVMVNPAGLPEGISSSPVTVAPETSADIRFEASGSAPHGGPHHVTLTGVTEEITAEAELELYVAGEAGTLDESFGSGGIVTRNLTDDYDAVRDVAVTSEGKLLVAGVSQSEESQAFAFRLDSDGKLDRSFASDGLLLSDPGGTRSSYHGLALLPDGDFLIAGNYRPADEFLPFVTRHGPDGFRTMEFGTDGMLGLPDILSVRGLDLYDDQFVTGGPGAVGLWSTAGEPVTSFGDEGLAMDVLRRAPQFDDTGRVLQGHTAVGAFGVLRLLRDGRRDGSFGDGGLAEIPVEDPGNDGYFIAMASGADGLVVIGVELIAAQDNGMLARLNDDGSLDETFGDAGVVMLTDADTHIFPTDVAIDSAGQIVVLQFEQTSDATSINEGLARFNSDGTIDSTFGTEGFTPIDILSVQKLVLDQRSGRAYVLGSGAGRLSVARVWL